MEEKKVSRLKLVKGTLHMEIPLVIVNDKGIGYIKLVESEETPMIVREYHGKSYVLYDGMIPRIIGQTFVPIKENFDELEGEEKPADEEEI